MKRASWFIGLIALIGITGCSMNSDLPSNPDERILFVKAQTQAAEMKAAKLVPPDARSDIREIPKGTLLMCSSGRQWSGNVKINLVDPAAGETVLNKLSDAAADEGFTVSRDSTTMDTPRVRMVDPNGAVLLATVQADGKFVDIDSFSECFSLPEDFVPDTSY